MKQIVVVGAGISGLSLAWTIQRSMGESVRIRVLESSPRIGGTAWTQRAAGYSLEAGPHGFLDNRAAIMNLCRDLGMQRDLVVACPSARHRYIFLGDRLRRLPRGPIEFLWSDLLSMSGKLRLLAEPWSAPPAVLDETIHQWGCRRIGREAAEILLDAYVTGILAGDSMRLSLSACFPYLAAMERDHGSLFRAMIAPRKAQHSEIGKPAGDESEQPATSSRLGKLTTLRGGIGSLVIQLSERLALPVELESKVVSLERAGGLWKVLAAGEESAADAVVLACPAQEQGRLLQPIDAELAADIRSIPYNAVAVCALGYANEDLPYTPKGFGYLTPQRLGRPVLGVVFSSSVFPHQAPSGHFQFRAILGGSQRPDVVDWTDAAIVQAVRDDLRATLGIEAMPVFDWICRWPAAIPQYYVGHHEKLTRLQRKLESLPGLFLGGNAYRGVSLNDCAADAVALAQAIRDYLRRTVDTETGR